MTMPASEWKDAEPEVDIVIAVHSAERAVERALGSVLRGTKASVRATVVCHHVEPARIAARLGSLADDPRTRLLAFADGVPSPAGPFNFGLTAATGRFTTVLGSDDELEPGAIDSWLALQRQDDAHIIIPAVRFSDGQSLGTPPTRPLRRRRLNGARDRLAYRTAQLGLVERERFGSLRFTANLASGEDVAYGLRLWFSGARISFDRDGPAYRIHTDASDRTTVAGRSVREDFAFLNAAIAPDWVATLSAADREAIAVKLLRTHVLDALRARFLDPDNQRAAEREELSTVIERIVELAPRVLGIVSALDSRLLQAVLDPSTEPAVITALLRQRMPLLQQRNLLPASLKHLLHREAPPRFYGAVLLAR